MTIIHRNGIRTEGDGTEGDKVRRIGRWSLVLLVLLALAIGVLALAWVRGGPVAMREMATDVYSGPNSLAVGQVGE